MHGRGVVLAAFACAALTCCRARWARAETPSPEEAPLQEPTPPPPEEEAESPAREQPPTEEPAPLEPPEPRHFVGVWGGLADTQALDDGIEGSGTGGLGFIEYIFRPLRAVSLRPYAGVLITSADKDCGPAVSPCDVSARQFLMGGKVRLEVPIPYVAPFLDIGIGYSLGTAVTRVGTKVDVSRSGLMYHIPFGFGLALGEHHEFELSLQAFLEPQPRQFLSGVAVGVTIPLR